jgi:hypothetical protein
LTNFNTPRSLEEALTEFKVENGRRTKLQIMEVPGSKDQSEWDKQKPLLMRRVFQRSRNRKSKRVRRNEIKAEIDKVKGVDASRQECDENWDKGEADALKNKLQRLEVRKAKRAKRKASFSVEKKSQLARKKAERKARRAQERLEFDGLTAGQMRIKIRLQGRVETGEVLVGFVLLF